AATSLDPEDQYPDCEEEDIILFFGDGYCDSATLNTEECGFDGGDCCECTCKGDGVDSRAICLDGHYECLDTSASCFGAPTPAPTPGVDPPTEGDDAIVTEDSSVSLSRATSATVAATSAFVATALGGVVAGMLG
ncbi:unnamed protein product, partial [Pylaiella littoralis]